MSEQHKAETQEIEAKHAQAFENTQSEHLSALEAQKVWRVGGKRVITCTSAID